MMYLPPALFAEHTILASCILVLCKNSGLMHHLALFPYQFPHVFGCETYFANQTDNETELSASLIIGRSCNVSQTVANPSCNMHTAATECYPR